MLDKNPAAQASYSESEWWARLASIANQPEVQRASEKVLPQATTVRSEWGFRLNSWGPLPSASSKASSSLRKWFHLDHFRLIKIRLY